MRVRQLDHRADIVLRLLRGHRAGIAGNVVGARHDVYHRRMEIDHVLPETDQHLRRGLAADAAPDPLGREEAGRHVGPILGDRIAHEDDARMLGIGHELPVSLSVSGEVGPVSRQPLVPVDRELVLRVERDLRECSPACQRRGTRRQ
jgi:hypothetical protein